jgi:probable rRNA maturation factor
VLAQAAGRVLRWERAARTRIELTLLDAPAMRRLNRRATGRRALTDVIAYALPQADGSLVGDVYICPAAAQRWAGNGHAKREELLRLVIHGTLHVLGYDHPEGAGRTRSRMWKQQEKYLNRLTARAKRS